MSLFAEYVAWQNFAATKVAEAEIEEARAEANERLVVSVHTLRADPKEKVTNVRAAIHSLPEVEVARNRFLAAYAGRKMAQVVYTNCERLVSLMSRELSRRIGREGTERRNMRWQP